MLASIVKVSFRLSARLPRWWLFTEVRNSPSWLSSSEYTIFCGDPETPAPFFSPLRLANRPAVLQIALSQSIGFRADPCRRRNPPIDRWRKLICIWPAARYWRRKIRDDDQSLLPARRAKLRRRCPVWIRTACGYGADRRLHDKQPRMMVCLSIEPRQPPPYTLSIYSGRPPAPFYPKKAACEDSQTRAQDKRCHHGRRRSLLHQGVRAPIPTVRSGREPTISGTGIFPASQRHQLIHHKRHAPI